MLFLTAWEKVNGLKRERERERVCETQCVPGGEIETPNKGSMTITYYEFFVCLRLPRKLFFSFFFNNILCLIFYLFIIIIFIFLTMFL
jgi:hypothetical protein